MRARFTILLMAALLLVAAQAPAQQLFDFLGQAVVATAPGGTLTMYSVLNDPSPAGSTPIPLDFANYQYTLVVTDLQLLVDGTPQQYGNGVIAIYQDAATPADYADPATFTDGEAILTGVVTTLTRMMFTATLGNANGAVDWTGGTMLDLIAPQDQTGWPFLSGINADSFNVEPGYDEQWDGKVEPTEPIVATEARTWSQVKALY